LPLLTINFASYQLSLMSRGRR